MNQVFLTGHLGKDPDVKNLPSGTRVANTSIAVTERWRDRASGQPKQKTNWIDLGFFGKGADLAERLLRKGSKVAIIGKLTQNSWQTQQGQKRSRVQVDVREFELLTPKGQSGSRNRCPFNPSQVD